MKISALLTPTYREMAAAYGLRPRLLENMGTDDWDELIEHRPA